MKRSLAVVAALCLAAPAAAHENPTAAGFNAALRSCDRNYGLWPGSCDVYGTGPAGAHSYKAYVYWPSGGTWCRASYTIGHDEQVWEHHATYCGSRA